MSTPNYLTLKKEYMEELKRKCFKEAGLTYWGRNEEGEMEFIGTDKQWKEATKLLEESINE